MKKHQHNWQFVREFVIDEVNRLLWKENLENGWYSKFVCECGAVKLVKQMR